MTKVEAVSRLDLCVLLPVFIQFQRSEPLAMDYSVLVLNSPIVPVYGSKVK
jgi:hypothetical protein